MDDELFIELCRQAYHVHQGMITPGEFAIAMQAKIVTASDSQVEYLCAQLDKHVPTMEWLKAIG